MQTQRKAFFVSSLALNVTSLIENESLLPSGCPIHAIV